MGWGNLRQNQLNINSYLHIQLEQAVPADPVPTRIFELGPLLAHVINIRSLFRTLRVFRLRENKSHLEKIYINQEKVSRVL